METAPPAPTFVSDREPLEQLVTVNQQTNKQTNQRTNSSTIQPTASRVIKKLASVVTNSPSCELPSKPTINQANQTTNQATVTWRTPLNKFLRYAFRLRQTMEVTNRCANFLRLKEQRDRRVFIQTTKTTKITRTTISTSTNKAPKLDDDDDSNNNNKYYNNNKQQQQQQEQHQQQQNQYPTTLSQKIDGI